MGIARQLHPFILFQVLQVELHFFHAHAANVLRPLVDFFKIMAQVIIPWPFSRQRQGVDWGELPETGIP